MCVGFVILVSFNIKGFIQFCLPESYLEVKNRQVSKKRIKFSAKIPKEKKSIFDSHFSECQHNERKLE